MTVEVKALWRASIGSHPPHPAVVTHMVAGSIHTAGRTFDTWHERRL